MTTRLATVLAALLAIGLLAVPASAQPDRPNHSLRSQATPADIDSGDVTFEEIDGSDYIAVDHGFDGADYVWCEPNRLGGADECFEGEDSFGTIYLGISNSEGDPVHHRGQVSVYYETTDGWRSVVAQFNGQGELVRINDQRF